MLFPREIRRGSEVHNVGVRWVVYSRGGAGQNGNRHVLWLIRAYAIIPPLSQIFIGIRFALVPGPCLSRSQNRHSQRTSTCGRPIVNRMNRSHIVVHIFLRERNFKFAAPSRFNIDLGSELLEDQTGSEDKTQF